MTLNQARLLLITLIFIRSTAFLFSKLTLQTMSPFNLLGLRFLLAFILLVLIFYKKILASKRADIYHGAMIGGAFFACMAFEMYALRITEITTVSFLENSAIIMVPLFESLLQRKFPSKTVLLCGVITFAGVGILASRSGNLLGGGEIYCLMAAFMYAISMILTGRFSQKDSPLLLGIYQIGFLGLFSMVASCCTEAARLPSGNTEWSCILVLALLCTCIGFTLQPIAQKYVSTEETAQYCAVNPLCASIIGTLILGESFGSRGALGAILILLGLILHGRLANKYNSVHAELNHITQ